MQQAAENWNPPKVKATSQVLRMPHCRSVFHKCRKCAACSWHLISPCYSDPELEPLGLETTAALPSGFHIQWSRSLTRLPQSEHYRSKVASNLKGLQVNLHQSIAGEAMRWTMMNRGKALVALTKFFAWHLSSKVVKPRGLVHGLRWPLHAFVGLVLLAGIQKMLLFRLLWVSWNFPCSMFFSCQNLKSTRDSFHVLPHSM